MPCSDLSVLIIDDNLGEFELLKESFNEECHGLQMRHCSTVDDALTLIRSSSPQQVPDAVLVDYRLPGSTGVEVIQALASHPHWKHVPRIIMTGSVDRLMQEHCRHAGAHEFLVKPTDFAGYLHFARALTIRMRQAKPRPSS